MRTVASAILSQDLRVGDLEPTASTKEKALDRFPVNRFTLEEGGDLGQRRDDLLNLLSNLAGVPHTPSYRTMRSAS